MREGKVVRVYKAPRNGKPYSEEGLHDLERQCLDAAKDGDSSLLEMAGLAIRRLLSERRESVQQRMCAKCRGDGRVLGPSDSGYRDCPACDGKGF
jgi:hypothetical protein